MVQKDPTTIQQQCWLLVFIKCAEKPNFMTTCVVGQVNLLNLLMHGVCMELAKFQCH